MCLSFLACCACRTCARVAESSCTLCGKVLPISITRIAYITIFLVTALLSWLLGTFLSPTDWNRLSEFRQCDGDSNARACYINLSVSRFLFVLAVWHLLQALALVGVSDPEEPRAELHNGWWTPKLIVLVGGVVGVLWLPNPFFIVWGWISLIGAALFIIVQIILLIDFICEWAHQWVLNMENEAEADGVSPLDEGGYCCPGGSCNRWFTLLLSATMLSYLTGITISVLLYVFFTRQPTEGACPKAPVNATFVSINLVLGLVATVISVLPRVRQRKPDSGLLQSAVVFLYTSYLMFSSLVSEPPAWIAGCNDTITPASNTGAGTSGQKTVIIIGAIFTVLAVSWSTFRNSSRGDSLSTPYTSLTDSSSSSGAGSSLPYSYTTFHVIFTLGAMYIQQLLTNWQTISKPDAADSSTSLITVDNGLASVWVKVVSSWLVYLLYLWSLIAPIIFPDRDFGN